MSEVNLVETSISSIEELEEVIAYSVETGVEVDVDKDGNVSGKATAKTLW